MKQNDTAWRNEKLFIIAGWGLLVIKRSPGRCTRPFHLGYSRPRASQPIVKDKFLKIIYLLTYIFCAGSSLLHSLFSSCEERTALPLNSGAPGFIAVASLVSEHRLWSAGSIVGVRQPAAPACGIFPDKESNTAPALAGGS